MKIVLHMGLHKTGTTSLQSALFQARSALRARGVAYPDGGAGRENHKLLTVLFKPDELVTRNVKFLFDQDLARMRRAAARMWETAKREVARTRPKLLILSSEFFFIDPRPQDFERLRDLLTPLSDDITPVLYFREPSAHFASNVQQNVKNGRAFEPIKGGRLEREAPMIEAAFGRPIVVCAADRGQLVQGDIVADFLARFVAPVAGEIAVAPVRLNESGSAEALAIVDRFRKLRHAGHVGPMPERHALRTILSRLEQAGDPSRSPRLKPEIARAVQRATTDLIWLRRRYGLEFAGVDYAAIDGAPFDPDPERTSVEELFDVDPARRDALVAGVLAETLAAWRQVERVPRAMRGLGAVGSGWWSRRRLGPA